MHATSSIDADIIDDLALIQIVSRSADCREGIVALLRALEERLGAPALALRQGEGERQSTLVEAGELATALLHAAPGDKIGHLLPDPAPVSGLRRAVVGAEDQTGWTLPLAGLSDLHLLLISSEDLVVARAQATLSRLAPILAQAVAHETISREQRVLARVLQLSEHQTEPANGTLDQVTDLIVEMGAVSAWLWYLAHDGRWHAGACSGAAPTADIGALLGALPDHGARAPFMDLSTRVMLVPLQPQVHVPAFVGVAFAPCWPESRCADLLSHLNGLLDKPWFARLVQHLVNRSAGTVPLVEHAERVAAEINRVVERFGEERIEDLKSLTQTAAKMTHEVRNKLNVVATGAYLLKMKTGPQLGDGVQRLFQQIEENIQASSHLMNELLQAYRRWPK